MNKKFLSFFKESLYDYRILKKKISSTQKSNYSHEFISLYKKVCSLKKILLTFFSYKKILKKISNTKILLNKDNFDIRSLVLEEIRVLEIKKIEYECILKKFLIPDKPYAKNNVFMELRSASGGDESSIFVKNLSKMYLNFFDFQKWKVELMSCTRGNSGGYKDMIFLIIGNMAFDKLKYESGTHRVQRVPKTDASKRIHTSTCTVAVLPEFKKDNTLNLNVNDLKVDTYRASGAGGQHVNVTDSAVRITHIPTGIVAECQNERSQHKNKQKALSLLRSRLLSHRESKKKNFLDNKRKVLIGSGSRAEKIRTYNFISNRITDHRLKLTLYKLKEIMNGRLDLIINKFS